MTTKQNFPAFPTTVPAAQQYPQVLSKQDITSFDTASPASTGNLTMDASQGSVFTVSLTEDILNWVIENPTDGQEILVIWRQNSTGGWTVTAADNLEGLIAPSGAANSTTVQAFVYDASGAVGSPPVDGVWYASEAGGGGGGVTLQTNGTDNGSQTLLNLAAGTNVTLTDNGTGTVTIAASGGGGGGVSSLNTYTGDITIAAGTGITVTNTDTGSPAAPTITIAATGGGGGATVKSGNYTAVSGDSGTLLAFNTNGGAGYALAQTATGSTTSATFGSAPPNGQLIIVTIGSSSSGSCTVSGLGATWTQVQTPTNSGDGYYTSMFWGIANGSGTVVTVSGQGGSFPGVAAYAFSGAAASPTVTTNSGTGTGTSTTETVSVGTSNSLVVMYTRIKNNSLTGTTSSPYSIVPASGSSTAWFVYGVSSSTGTITPPLNFATSQSWGSNVAAFTPAAGASYTLTLPSSPPSSTWNIHTVNYGVGTLTIDPNGLDLNGSSGSLTGIAQNEGYFITTDGTNYFYI